MSKQIAVCLVAIAALAVAVQTDARGAPGHDEAGSS